MCEFTEYIKKQDVVDILSKLHEQELKNIPDLLEIPVTRMAVRKEYRGLCFNLERKVYEVIYKSSCFETEDDCYRETLKEIEGLNFYLKRYDINNIKIQSRIVEIHSSEWK